MDTPRVFSQLLDEIQSRLRNVMHLQTFEPGEPVFHQGAPVAAIYAVVNGRVKIARVTPDGYECILCVRKSGEYFCPVPVLDGKTQLGTAIAMTSLTVLWMERETFQSLCRAYPQLLSTVEGDCLAEVRYLLNRLETFAFRNIRERLAIALLDEIRNLRIETSSPIELNMIQQELAGLVGASRESVSRSLKRLEKEKIVELHRGRIRILDVKKLREISATE